ncbi:hypothetical protein RJT34_30757 [Clitoria ternatea]|uniref:Pentatricopeptide repeat-containing protein n=1 Tax=Clitoria ternatea TaxID=43366 RepID=A0AAN9ETE8_CLITE
MTLELSFEENNDPEIEDNDVANVINSKDNFLTAAIDLEDEHEEIKRVQEVKYDAIVYEEGENSDGNETLNFVNSSSIEDDFIALEDEENTKYFETGIRKHPISMEERQKPRLRYLAITSLFAMLQPLHVCISLLDTKISEDIVGREFHLDSCDRNSMINFLIKCGNLDDAWWVFDEILERDVVCLDLIIGGYFQECLFKKVTQLFFEIVGYRTRSSLVAMSSFLKNMDEVDVENLEAYAIKG